MISTKLKALVVVFVLLLFTSIITVGCKQKANDGLIVRTSQSEKAQKKHYPNIVYLGSDGNTSGGNFGPKDVSFEFQTLR